MLISVALARRYAVALFSVAKKEGNIPVYGEKLSLIVKVLENSPDISSFLTHPLQTNEIKIQTVKSLREELGFSQGLENLLFLLIERRRIHYLSKIAELYQGLADELNQIMRAELYLAAALSAYLIKELEDRLCDIFGKKVIVEVKIDPGILGGAIVKVENMIWDGSLKGRINRLKEKIAG